MTNITFVNEKDESIGAGSKQEALEKEIIHRVIRIFITNSKGEILLQKRSDNSTLPGKWDQSAGGHVDEGESYEQASYRELKEEIGVEGIQLQELGKYYSESEDIPHRKRFNMLYTGAYDGEAKNDPQEVSEVRWIIPSDLDKWISRSPEDFTVGCINAYQRYKTAISH